MVNLRLGYANPNGAFFQIRLRQNKTSLALFHSKFAFKETRGYSRNADKDGESNTVILAALEGTDRRQEEVIEGHRRRTDGKEPGPESAKPAGECHGSGENQKW
jgi:hypothetical protein